MNADETRAELLGRLETLLAWEAAESDAGLPAAREAFTALAAECRAALGPNNMATVEADVHLARLQAECDRIDASLDGWHELAERAGTAPGADRALVLRARMLHAQYLRRRGRPEDLDAGITHYRDILAYLEDTCATDAYQTSIARSNLAVALRDRGRAEDLQEAAALVDAEIERRVRVHGRDQPLTWTAWAIYADILLDQSEAETDPARAREDADRALEVASRVTRLRVAHYGGSSSKTLTARRREARALIALSRRAEAVRLLERNRLIEEVTGRGRHGTTEALLAEALRIDDPDQALHYAVASLRLLENRYGMDAPRVAKARRTAEALSPRHR